MANMEMVKKQAAGSQLVTVEDYLKKNEHLIVRALNNTISPERFLAITNIVMQSPALQGCSQNSLVAAVLQTVQVGLTPGAVNHVYFVPFKNAQGVKEIQLIISYKGMCELVNRSKEATVLNAECVYEKDQFQYEKGINPVLRHIPASGDRGAFIGVYAIAKNMLAGEKVFEFLSKEEIEKVRQASKGGNSEYSPWTKWFDAMAKKTAVKRLCKLLPLSVEVQQTLSADETVKTNIAPKMVDVPDKTDWNAEDAEIVTPKAEEKPISKPEDIVCSPEPAKTEQTPAPAILEAPIGSVIQEYKGVVKSFKTRAVGKDKKEITDYMIEDEFGLEHKITKWGAAREGVKDAICTFKNIKVEEYKETRQYLANDITTGEIVWTE